MYRFVQSMAQRSPLERIGEACEIGQLACSKCADNCPLTYIYGIGVPRDASSYVNGVELFADGGLTQVA
jgi:hypothetical protein